MKTMAELPPSTPKVAAYYVSKLEHALSMVAKAVERERGGEREAGDTLQDISVALHSVTTLTNPTSLSACSESYDKQLAGIIVDDDGRTLGGDDERDVNPWDVLRHIRDELASLTEGLGADGSHVAAGWCEALHSRVGVALSDKRAARSIFVGGDRYEAPDKALELMPVIDGLARQIVRAVPRNDLKTEDRERLITGLAEDIREQIAKVKAEGGL